MPFIQFQHRRDTAAKWTLNNPTLADGEMGLETDTTLFKIGNGTTAWTGLAYGGIKGATGPTGPAAAPAPAYVFVGGDAFQNYSVGPAFDCGSST
jgi:hypothetical protein